MAKKSYKFSYDAPVTLTFFILSAAVFIIDTYVVKGFLSEKALTCLGSFEGHKFNPSEPLDYVRLFCHVFGNGNWAAFLMNSAFVLLTGPVLEERYGSGAVGLMFFVTAVVSGVLGQTVSPYPMTGSTGIVFMMLLLSFIMAFSRKEIKLSYILIFLLYGAYSFYENFEKNADEKTFLTFLMANIPTFISLAAGLCGSVFGFLVAPKKPKNEEREEKKPGKSRGKRKSKKDFHSDETVENAYSSVAQESTDNAGYVPDSSDTVSAAEAGSSDETVIGSIEF